LKTDPSGKSTCLEVVTFGPYAKGLFVAGSDDMGLAQFACGQVGELKAWKEVNDEAGALEAFLRPRQGLGVHVPIPSAFS
jgi:hypothetical protein